MSLGKRALAEFFGTFWLVFGGCGAAVLAAGFPTLGIKFAGVALAFGLTVLTMAFAIGHVSGCHLNPAISLGLVAGKRFAASDLIPYVIAQVLGAIAAAGVLFIIASGNGPPSMCTPASHQTVTVCIPQEAILCSRVL
jgi:aquaporin Z